MPMVWTFFLPVDASTTAQNSIGLGSSNVGILAGGVGINAIGVNIDAGNVNIDTDDAVNIDAGFVNIESDNGNKATIKIDDGDIILEAGAGVGDGVAVITNDGDFTVDGSTVLP